MNTNKVKLVAEYSEFSCLIPLRGGSKGIPRKNLALINNKPLYSYVAQSSLSAGVSTYVSTEDKEIIDSCNTRFPEINVLIRPQHLASDTSTTESVVDHFLSSVSNAKHIILLQATSPMTSTLNIKEAIALYLKHDCQPLISVVKEHFFLWSKDGNPVNYDPFKRPRRQDWDGLFIENGAIYIFSREYFEKNKSRCCERSTLYLMNSTTLFEVDTVDDLNNISKLL